MVGLTNGVELLKIRAKERSFMDVEIKNIKLTIKPKISPRKREEKEPETDLILVYQLRKSQPHNSKKR